MTITCYLQGGLGNQLFQIFTTIAYAIKNNRKFFFSNAYELNKGSIHRHTYWLSFLSNLRPFLINISEETISTFVIMKEPNFSYNELPPCYSQDTIKMLVGYFQSSKYFEQYKQPICKMIKLETSKNNVYTKYPLDYRNMISLHFRLGDYKKLQDYHPIMTLDYYKQSIAYILRKMSFTDTIHDVKILYFCEDDDYAEVRTKIEELKKHFQLDFIRGGHNLEDWEEMLQMSLCKYNIIANSTFSWWAAYFNTNEEQIIVYPSIWFGPKSKHDTKDLFPEKWVCI